MGFRLMAHIYSYGITEPIQRINFDINTVEVDLSNGEGDFYEFDFDEVQIFMEML